jgi:undecaprenyl-diphosphatase
VTHLDALLLGALQGLTEFLPISSDGHLALLQLGLGLKLEGRDFLGFEILLHAGSLIALFVAYQGTWQRLLTSLWTPGQRGDRHTMLLLIIATLPGVIAGLLWQDVFAEQFRGLGWLGTFFLVTALLLVLAEREVQGRRRRTLALHDVPWLGALLIGIAQALALLPSLSRSGATASAARALGLSREEALDFAFLLAAPILLGAVLLTSVQVWMGDITLPPASVTLTGFITSLVVSLWAVHWLRRLVSRRPLSVFCWYLVPVGLTCLGLSLR